MILLSAYYSRRHCVLLNVSRYFEKISTDQNMYVVWLFYRTCPLDCLGYLKAYICDINAKIVLTNGVVGFSLAELNYRN